MLSRRCFATFRLSRLTALVAGALLCVAGCRRAKTSPPSAAPPAVSPGEPVLTRAMTRDELESFGRQLEERINGGQIRELAALIDFGPLLAAAFAGVNLEGNPETRSFHDELVRSLRVDPAQVLKSLGGARARFLRVEESAMGGAVVIRCLLPSGAGTYLRIFPRAPIGRPPGIREIYNHATGLSLEAALRSIVITIVAKLDVSFLEHAFAVRRKIDAGAFTDLADALRKKDVRQAKLAFAKIPEELRHSRPVFMSYVQVLMQNPRDPDYLAALEEGARLYPADPALDFLRIDLHLLHKDYAAYDACLRRLEEALGVDAHLLTLRGAGYAEAGNYEEAEALVNRAVDLEPDFENAYRLRIKLAVLRRRPADAIAAIEQLEQRFGQRWTPGPSEANPAFQDFVQSPAYRTWSARR